MAGTDAARSAAAVGIVLRRIPEGCPVAESTRRTQSADYPALRVCCGTWRAHAIVRRTSLPCRPNAIRGQQPGDPVKFLAMIALGLTTVSLACGGGSSHKSSML